MCFFHPSAFFSPLAAGLSTCSRLRGTQGARPDPIRKIGARPRSVARALGVESGTSARGSIPSTQSHPGPRKPTYRLKECPTGYACCAGFWWRLALWMPAHPSCSCSSARVRAAVSSCSSTCSSPRVLVSARVLECSSCSSVGGQVFVVHVLECSSARVHDCPWCSSAHVLVLVRVPECSRARARVRALERW